MSQPSASIRLVRTVADVTAADLTGLAPTSRSGAFGSLWRAGAEGRYAIKVFSGATDGREVEEELSLLTKLADSGVAPRAYGWGWFRNPESHVESPAIVQEFVDGQTLADVVQGGWLSGGEGRGLEAWQVIQVALGVTDDLVTLRGYDIAHRDLSPRNVMLTSRVLADLDRGVLPAGERGADARLIDFGQSVGRDETVTPVSVGPRLATIAYGAPEVFGGEHYARRNDPAVDMWSLGALVAFLVLGSAPWPDALPSPSTADPTFLLRVVDAKRVPLDLPSLLGRGLSGPVEEGLEWVVRTCTAFDPAKRPTPVVARRVLRQLADRPEGRPPDVATLTPVAVPAWEQEAGTPPGEAGPAAGEPSTEMRSRGPSGESRRKARGRSLSRRGLVLAAIGAAAVAGLAVVSRRLGLTDADDDAVVATDGAAESGSGTSPQPADASSAGASQAGLEGYEVSGERGGFLYAGSSDGVTVYDYSGDETELTIPSSIDAHPVLALDFSSTSDLPREHANFTHATSISLGGRTSLVSADVTACEDLLSLDCSNSGIASLSVGGLQRLEVLDVSFSSLTSIDLSGLVALRSLDTSYSQITDLHVNALAALTSLECTSPALTTLVVYGCDGIGEVGCPYSSALTQAVFSECPSLGRVDVSDCALTELSTNTCDALLELDCASNQLTSLTVSWNPALERLNCSNNQLEWVSAQPLENLRRVECAHNSLTSLYLMDCPSLREVVANDNAILDADFDGCDGLSTVDVRDNPIAESAWFLDKMNDKGVTVFA